MIYKSPAEPWATACAGPSACRKTWRSDALLIRIEFRLWAVSLPGWSFKYLLDLLQWTDVTQPCCDVLPFLRNSSFCVPYLQPHAACVCEIDGGTVHQSSRENAHSHQESEGYEGERWGLTTLPSMHLHPVWCYLTVSRSRQSCGCDFIQMTKKKKKRFLYKCSIMIHRHA